MVKTAPQRKKRKKTTKVSLLRMYGLTGAEWMRYKNPVEKGIYWFFFSKAIRKRDVEKYGTCISCDRPITVETCDAGHFIPAGSCGPVLLFDPRNVNAECSHCNAWDDLHLLGYARNLDKRYGAETSEGLLAQHRANKGTLTKDFTRKQYIEKLAEIKIYGL